MIILLFFVGVYASVHNINNNNTAMGVEQFRREYITNKFNKYTYTYIHVNMVVAVAVEYI